MSGIWRNRTTLPLLTANNNGKPAGLSLSTGTLLTTGGNRSSSFVTGKWVRPRVSESDPALKDRSWSYQIVKGFLF